LGQRSQSPLSTKENIRLDISDRGRAMLANQAVCETEDTEDNVLELTDLEKEKIRLIQDFIYVLTGKRIKFLVPRSITKDQLNKLRDIQGQTVGSGSPQRRAGAWTTHGKDGLRSMRKWIFPPQAL
jgi:hypothetical protein